MRITLEVLYEIHSQKPRPKHIFRLFRSGAGGIGTYGQVLT